MADFILGERSGLPRIEAIVIIEDIQLRGCNLSGTRAERALETLLEEPGPTKAEKERAAGALTSIRRGLNLKGHLDTLRGGACEEGRPN